MEETIKISNKDPLYQKVKRLNLDVLRLAKDAIELAKLNQEIHICMLENTIEIIGQLSEKVGYIKGFQESLISFKKTCKMLQGYEDKLINMELLIEKYIKKTKNAR